jgi:hypothetical protein
MLKGFICITLLTMASLSHADLSELKSLETKKLLSKQEKYYVKSGNSLTVKVKDKIDNYESMTCTVEIEESFFEEYGPFISIMLGDPSAKGEVLQFGMLESGDSQWVFRYDVKKARQNENLFKRPTIATSIPKKNIPIQLTLTKFLDLVYYRVYAKDYIYSEGYIPYDARALPTGFLTLSSSSGTYMCEIYRPKSTQ